MKTTLRLVMGLALLAACATSGAGNTVTVTARASLVIGIVTYSGSATAESDGQALSAYLSQKLGREVAAKVFETETLLGEAIATGQVDLAWMPPFAFVDAQRTGKVTALAKLVRHGLPFYRSVIFVKADNPASSLKDLQGQRVAWVQKSSAAGYLFPRAALIANHLKPEELFKKETFYGDHAAVCNAVLSGDADVGATYADDRGKERLIVDGCQQSSGDAAKSLRIILVSAPIPNDVIAARAGLPDEDVARIQKIFMALGPGADDGKLLTVFRADSFTDVGADDFDPVREAADAATK